MTQPRLESVTEADLPAIIRIIVHAFAGTPEGTKDWFTAAGHEHLRILRTPEPGPPPACLLRVPMGQYFGGRSVSMLGIAGVGVAPEARGKGFAKEMMVQAVRQGADDGFALSVLYPSTQPLYRSAGYEQAGHRLMVRIPIAEIDPRQPGLDVCHLGDSDWPAVKSCYNAFAPQFDGMVDRGRYVWDRVAKWQDQKFQGFGIRNPASGLDGYAFLSQKRKDNARQEISVQDLAFLTPAAGRRILRFLGEFGTMGDDVVFHAGPSHPALMLLARQKYKMEFAHYWMLRILSVEKAFAERGYPPGVRADLELDIRDEAIPGNAGRWTVSIQDGRARVARGGSGRIKADIRGLAALYTGHLTPAALALTGLIHADPASLQAAAPAFAGTPWMTDFF